MLHSSSYALTFARTISKIDINADRVRIFVGVTYGTCGDFNDWWGWSTSDPRHKDWLSLAMTATVTGKEVEVVDVHDSCSGPGDAVGLEELNLIF